MELTTQQKADKIKEINDERDYCEDVIAELISSLDVINSVEITIRTEKEVTFDCTAETKAQIVTLAKMDLQRRSLELFSQAEQLMK